MAPCRLASAVENQGKGGNLSGKAGETGDAIVKETTLFLLGYGAGMIHDPAPDSLKFLAGHPLMGPLATQAQLPALKPQPELLIAFGSSVIGQQLSGKAAASIEAKFCAAFGGSWPDAPTLCQTTISELRACGLSYAKAETLHRLANALTEAPIAAGDAQFMTDEEILKRFTSLKGIGPWTVQMVMIFDLGRPDVWPVGDLAIRTGVARLVGASELPKPREMEAWAHEYAGHRSTVARLIWHALDQKWLPPVS
jgi:3-methyladenine DNA glycosylase/8-oxoguanine DNA glycosylase